jgi:hypothetical protein
MEFEIQRLGKSTDLFLWSKFEFVWNFVKFIHFDRKFLTLHYFILHAQDLRS